MHSKTANTRSERTHAGMPRPTKSEMASNRDFFVKKLLRSTEDTPLEAGVYRACEERDFRRTSIQIASGFGVARCVRNAIIGTRLQGSALKSWSVY